MLLLYIIENLLGGAIIQIVGNLQKEATTLVVLMILII